MLRFAARDQQLQARKEIVSRRTLSSCKPVCKGRETLPTNPQRTNLHGMPCTHVCMTKPMHMLADREGMTTNQCVCGGGAVSVMKVSDVKERV